MEPVAQASGGAIGVHSALVWPEAAQQLPHWRVEAVQEAALASSAHAKTLIERRKKHYADISRGQAGMLHRQTQKGKLSAR